MIFTRRRLIAAAHATLARIAETDDAMLARDNETSELVRRLAEVVEGDREDVAAARALGWLHWQRSRGNPPDEGERIAAVFALTICFVRDRPGHLPEPLLPDLAERAYLTAVAWYADAVDDPARDLSSVIDLYRRILAVTEDRGFRAMRWTDLSVLLRTRYERAGAETDLNAAVEAAEAALAATEPDDEDRPEYLNDLANALSTRYERLRAASDLNTAVRLREETVQRAATDDPDLVAYLNNQGNTLLTRYHQTAAPTDLDDAIRALEAAHAADLAKDATTAQTTVTADDEPDAETRRALFTVPERPDPARRAAVLLNLGNALVARHTRSAAAGRPDDADLAAAVRCHREALDILPAGRPERPIVLNGLAATLWHTADRTGGHALRDEALRHFRAAADATPPGHPDRARTWAALATALAQPDPPGQKTRQDLRAAANAFELAADAPASPPTIRLQAAREAAARTAAHDAGHAADLLERAVRLLPAVAPRQLRRDDQQRLLETYAGLAGQAASLALADPRSPAPHRARRAARLLEAGRAVLFSQVLEARGDLTELRASHPALADRFVNLRALLDTPSDAPGATGRLDVTSTDITGGNRHRAAEQFAALLAEIRGKPGFVTFGAPPSATDLMREAHQGPIVFVNVSPVRSDALLLSPDGVEAIELPLTWDTLVERANTFHHCVHAFLNDPASEAGTRARHDTDRILGWLWDVIAEPVLTALRFDRRPEPGAWPRLWWVLSGPLGLLPLHAAGHHDDPDTPARRTVIDRVVSSYTPTVRALRYARQHRRAPTPSDVKQPSATPGLIVAMPTTPGDRKLPSAATDVTTLRRHLPGIVVLREPDPADPVGAPPEHLPTKANVLARLAGSPIVHFACHARSDPADPSRSTLLLHDHREDPLTVGEIAATVLPNARLAYLSACETALTSRPELIDEAINLAATFQLAGYPHVVGTLWQILDRRSAQISAAFYQHLAAGTSTLDVARSAHALHQATRAVSRTEPLLWAPYVHFGL